MSHIWLMLEDLRCLIRQRPFRICCSLLTLQPTSKLAVIAFYLDTSWLALGAGFSKILLPYVPCCITRTITTASLK